MTLLDKLFDIKDDLEAIGLIMTRDFESYFCTPLQAVVFAHSGVDGIHYCIVKNDGDQDESPVYFISPTMSDHYVELVGRNLTDFLSFVVKCKDASALECISYASEDMFNDHITKIEKELLKDPEFNKKVDDAISAIKSKFQIQEIDNIYKHVIETNRNPKYHAELNFSEEYYDIIDN